MINPEEAPTVKLMFFMYLYGFSSQQIADELNKLEKKTYYGKGGYGWHILAYELAYCHKYADYWK